MQNVDQTQKYLLVGLGNPGQKYSKTRHNLGFYLLDYLARKEGVVFKKDKGSLCGRSGGVFLLKPQTYMNLSGNSVVKFIRFYRIPVENLLVIVDDAAMPFGKVRLRDQGTSGGHNGLGHIQEVLQTKHYSRLRVGVGSPKDSDMADYVLGQFTEEEQKELPKIAEKAVYAIELWLKHGVFHAMNAVNVHPKQKEKMDEENEKKSL